MQNRRLPLSILVISIVLVAVSCMTTTTPPPSISEMKYVQEKIDNSGYDKSDIQNHLSHLLQGSTAYHKMLTNYGWKDACECSSVRLSGGNIVTTECDSSFDVRCPSSYRGLIKISVPVFSKRDGSVLRFPPTYVSRIKFQSTSQAIEAYNYILKWNELTTPPNVGTICILKPARPHFIHTETVKVDGILATPSKKLVPPDGCDSCWDIEEGERLIS